MEAQRVETGTEVESTRSAVQKVGRERDRGRKSKIREVIQKSDAVMASDFLFLKMKQENALLDLLRISKSNTRRPSADSKKILTVYL